MTDVEIEIGKTSDKYVEFSVWGDIPQSPFFNWGNCQVLFRFVDLARVLRGKYKITGYIIWEPLGSDAPEASDKLRLIRFLTKLPDEAFLQEMKTLDQLFQWVGFKNECIDIARCWLAGHGFPDNPLARYLMEGDVCGKHYHDRTWLTADMYDNLWKLLNQRQKKLKSAFVKQDWGYPFESPRAFLEEIMGCGVDSEFCVYLKHQHSSNTRENRKLATLGRKNIKNTASSKEIKELDALVSKHGQSNIWLHRLVTISEILAEHDSFIKTRLAVHKAFLDGIIALQQEATCNPQLKNLGLQQTSTWDNGEKFVGQKPKWKA